MELWKSLRTLSETVVASLPGDEGSLVHRQAGGWFRVFAPYHDQGRPYLGSAAVELGPEELKPDPVRWASALEEARRNQDPWYSLDLPATPLPVRTSTLEKQDLPRWVEPVVETIEIALRGGPVQAVRKHLRFERSLVQYRDSGGNEREEVRHGASVEVLLVPGADPLGHPFTAELRLGEFAPEVITGFLREQVQLTLKAREAVVWEPSGEFSVMLRGQALAATFDYLVAQLGGPALASGASTLGLGRPLWNRNFEEPLTVTALPFLYNAPGCRGFDEEGIVVQPRTLLKDGQVRGYWTTQATAHWMGLPLTGRPSCYSVSPGSVTWDSLSGRRILEVHRLRWAQVDSETGEFTAEVGLADLHEGARRSSVFGFTVQGNLKDILTKARFSADVGSWEHYEGPEFLVVPSGVAAWNGKPATSW